MLHMNKHVLIKALFEGVLHERCYEKFTELILKHL